MNTAEETSIREQLERAVEVLDPAAPPLAELEARAVKRRRTFRLTTGFGAVALAGAGAALVVVVITAGPGSTAKITPAASPTTQSLVDFATANGAIHSRFGRIIAGPFEGAAGFYGAFTVKPGVQVATWDGSDWQDDGGPVTKLGPGRFLMKLGPGPELAGAPSIYVRSMGGDVSYFGSVLGPAAAGWQTVRFGTCGHHKLCYPGDTEPYGRVHGHDMLSINNDCTPNCAAGTDWRVTWTWNSAANEFIATAVRGS